MKLIFKIDKNYDKEMLLEFMPRSGKADKQALADLLRIDAEDLNIILKNKNLNLKKIINISTQDKYKKLLPFLKNSVSDYQKSWDKINNRFFKLVSEKTKRSWKYKKYYCVVSAYHEGISSRGKNIIARRWSINADTQRKVTAHELVLSHFWNMLENNTISKEWPNDKKWQYSEIFSWCLLGLDEDFYIFWPWLLKSHLFPTNHQYKNIIPLQNKLKKLYLKCHNFTDFFEKAIKYER
jgi:hypothetical protein